jgi:hypothetical protein
VTWLDNFSKLYRFVRLADNGAYQALRWTVVARLQLPEDFGSARTRWWAEENMIYPVLGNALSNCAERAITELQSAVPAFENYTYPESMAGRYQIFSWPPKEGDRLDAERKAELLEAASSTVDVVPTNILPMDPASNIGLAALLRRVADTAYYNDTYETVVCDVNLYKRIIKVCCIVLAVCLIVFTDHAPPWLPTGGSHVCAPVAGLVAPC